MPAHSHSSRARRQFNIISSLALVALLLSTTLPLTAQQSSQTTAASAPLPVYDVVSIHENKSVSDNMSVHFGSDAYVANNVTLISLVMGAYNVREELISGLPGWAGSVHFDINAKISDPDPDALKKLTREQRQAMMVVLLTDRFHLKAHIVVKTLPVYDLVLAKGGSKLKENAAPPPTNLDPRASPSTLRPGSFRIGDSEMIGVAIPISMLAPNLAFHVERNVIDKTGLTGKYDINLKWRPDDKPAADDNNAPDLFTALQEQLGLKLEPSKGPVDTLVIDHVEMPSAN